MYDGNGGGWGCGGWLAMGPMMLIIGRDITVVLAGASTLVVGRISSTRHAPPTTSKSPSPATTTSRPPTTSPCGNLASDVPGLCAHVALRGEVTLHDAQQSGGRLEALLEDRFGIEHATLELECHPCDPSPDDTHRDAHDRAH